MLKSSKDIFKKIIKNHYKNESIFKSIKPRIFCNTCGGKGYIVIDKNKSKICHVCSGVGIISYTYF
tara:strand:+ start:706 stop:903 length:198 start_codon:yes stop_codon:yes gene_type:complete